MDSKSYFCSSGFIPDSKIETDSGTYLDMQELPPFLRTLMVMDGTVTKSLSAWFWEPVKVKPVLNQTEPLNHAIDGLDVKMGDTVICREVALVGEKSQMIFAYARSTVSLKNLPITIGTALENGKIGIGELLREQGVETYREIYSIDYYNKDRVKADELLSEVAGDIVSRSYRIKVNGIPSILVTEFFPLEVYGLSK